MEPIFAECLTAAIGPEAILRGTARAGRRVQMRALAWPALTRKLLRSFLERETPTRARGLPQLGYMATAALLARGVDQERSAALAAALHDPQAGAAVTETVMRLAGSLNAALPRKQRQTALGVELEQPGDQEWAAFRRRWMLVMEPLSVVARAASRQLTANDVSWYAEAWPALAADLALAVPAVAARVHGGRKQRFAMDVEHMMAIMMGLPPVVRDFQRLYVPPEGQPPAPRPGQVDLSAGSNNELTPEQNLSRPPMTAAG